MVRFDVAQCVDLTTGRFSNIVKKETGGNYFQPTNV
jgi:hypothetical protein